MDTNSGAKKSEKRYIQKRINKNVESHTQSQLYSDTQLNAIVK